VHLACTYIELDDIMDTPAGLGDDVDDFDDWLQEPAGALAASQPIVLASVPKGTVPRGRHLVGTLVGGPVRDPNEAERYAFSCGGGDAQGAQHPRRRTLTHSSGRLSSTSSTFLLSLYRHVYIPISLVAAAVGRYAA